MSSDVRLGIDLGIIEDIDMSILNELMIFMQPGFLQQYAKYGIITGRTGYIQGENIP